MTITIQDDPHDAQTHLRAQLNHRLLTHAEELALFACILPARHASASAAQRAIARDARNTLILHNMRLVVTVATKHRGYGLPLVDLVQVGVEGLCRATGKFDPAQGHRFSTYAHWWIRQACGRATYNHGATIRLPVHLGERRRAIQRAEAHHRARHGDDPAPAELVRATGLSAEQVARACNASGVTRSLDEPCDAAGDLRCFGEMLPSTAPAPDTLVMRASLRDDLRAALETLPPREARILRLRFGLDGAPPLTLVEVGAKFGLTRERIRQLEKEALAKLRGDLLRIHLDAA